MKMRWYAPQQHIKEILLKQEIAVCLLLSAVMLLPGMASVYAATSVSQHSVPARILLQYLAVKGIRPQTTLYRTGAPWESVDQLYASPYCLFSVDGTLTATVVPADLYATGCLFSLFAPGTQLSDGWRLKRFHWRGDTSSAVFIVNPTDTNHPYLNVLLEVPSGMFSRHLYLQLVTLQGPPDQHWQDAF